MATTALSDTQRQILEHAAKHGFGHVTWFPDQLRGGAQRKCIEALIRRDLIEPEVSPENLGYVLTAAGYEAVGMQKPHARENSKQAQIISMLRRAEGATIPQIMAVTGWQTHTVRGCLAGVLKKKFGDAITSEKLPDSDRVYRLAASTEAENVEKLAKTALVGNETLSEVA